MTKKEYENLGELQKLIYDYIQITVANNQFQVKVEEHFFDNQGYVKATLEMGGCKIPCSINEKGYVCFHTQFIISNLFESKSFEKKLVAIAKAEIGNNVKKIKAEKIKALEAEIKRLKKIK